MHELEPVKSEGTKTNRIVGAGILLFGLWVVGGLFRGLLPSGGDRALLDTVGLIIYGLLSAGLLLYRFRDLLPGPTWRVMVDPDTLQAGQSFQLQWQVVSRASWIARLRIELAQQEVAIDTRGTSDSRTTRTKTMPLSEGVTGYEIESGSRTFSLPQGILPTFETDHNKVHWRVVMVSRLKWPLTLKRDFAVTIIQPPFDPATAPSLPAAGAVEPTETISDDNAFSIQTSDNRTHFLPGQAVSGHATWHLERPDDTVEIRLIRFMTGKGNPDRVVVDQQRLSASSERGTFQFTLPQDGPYSFSGQIISLVWALELAIQPSTEAQQNRGRFQRKLGEKTAQLELVDSPTGQVLTHQPE